MTDCASCVLARLPISLLCLEALPWDPVSLNPSDFESDFSSDLKSQLILLLLSLGLASCGASSLFPSPPQTGSFSIQWRLLDPAPSPLQLAVFTQAAQRWQSLIAIELAPVGLRLGPNHCLPGSPPLQQQVDDLLIDVQTIPIDGPGQVLGLASPCVLCQLGQMPVYGFMQLDRDDLETLEASGQLETVLLHEIAHVLGFGSLRIAPGSQFPVEPHTPGSHYRELAYPGPFWWVDDQGSLTLQRTKRG